MSRGIYFIIDGIEVPLFMEVDLEGFDDPIVGFERSGLLDKSVALNPVSSDRLQVGFTPIRKI